MPHSVKDWKDFPDTSTPITAAALKDLESRLSGYTDSELAALTAADVGAVSQATLDAAIAAEQAARASAITDAKARANHTGSQAISTVTGLQTALDGKADDGDVTAEATARANADADLQEAIDAEATDREAADLSLADDIAAEATARDAAIQAAVNELLGVGVDVSLDTLKELGDAIEAGDDALQALLTGKQPLHATLTALAGKTPTTFGLNVLEWANAAAGIAALGLGTAAVLNVAASGNAAAGEVVKGNDTRLSDERTPSNNSVSGAKIQNNAIASTKLAPALKPSGTAAAGDEALRALGTSGSTAAAGNDSRFPTADQKAALAGNGVAAPSGSNPYATDQVTDGLDARLDQLRAGRVYVADHGAVGDGVMLFNATMTAGSAVLTDADAAFTVNDVGKVIIVSGVGPSNEALVSTIASRQSATQVTLAHTATVNSPDPADCKIAVYGTDDTAEIQAASDAAAADGAGSLVFEDRIYVLAGALQQGGARAANAQVTLPNLDYTDGLSRLTWQGHPGAGASPTMPLCHHKGTVLVSTLIGRSYSATYGIPSVIGGPTQELQDDHFSNLCFDVDSITVLTPRNPSLSAFNLEGLAGQNRRKVTAGTLTWGYPVDGLEELAIAEPTHPQAAAFIDPRTTNFQGGCGRSVEVSTWGYFCGIAPNEHSDITAIRIFNTKIAIGVRGGDGTIIEGMTHLARFGYVSAEGNAYIISGWDPSAGSAAAGVIGIPTAKALVDIDALDIEDYADTTLAVSWAVMVNHVNDPNGKLYGRIRYARWSYVAGVFTPMTALTISGGGNFVLLRANSKETAPYLVNLGDDAIDGLIPWTQQILPFIDDAIEVAGSWAIANLASTAPVLNGQLYNTSHALNDEVGWDVTLSKGTWNISLMYVKNTSLGRISLLVDGVAQAGFAEGYDATALYNSVAAWVVPIAASGKHRITFKVTAKHASAIDYYAALQLIQFRRTA